MTPYELFARPPSLENPTWQILTDHLSKVASRAEEFASAFGAGDLGYNAGILHDLGKADPAWQAYLRNSASGEARRGSGPDHKGAGAAVANERGQPDVAAVVLSHHGGLKDAAEMRSLLLDRSRRPGALAAKTSLDALAPGFRATPQRPMSLSKFFEATSQPPTRVLADCEMMIRLLFSAVVDADTLDAEQHAVGEGRPARGSETTLTMLHERFDAFESQFALADPGSTVNRVRAEVREACLESAALPRGMFRLTVPTGGGKTRAAVAFALEHARAHPEAKFRRIVVAVPFLTITQQTSAVYREIFDNPADEFPSVLEHHSPAFDNYDDEADGECTNIAAWPRLAAENWDAPLVVTTTVQLFESLYSNKRSKTRKLHNLARSIIVLDEAQSFPTAFLRPILDALRFLCEHAGCTIVLSTATQPAFDVIDEFAQLEAREIVPGNAAHFEQLQRVRHLQCPGQERIRRAIRIDAP